MFEHMIKVPKRLEDALVAMARAEAEQKTTEHSGLWVLVVTDGEAYSLAESKCGFVFETEAAAVAYAVQLLVTRNYVQRDGDGFVMEDGRYATEKDVLAEYQWSSSLPDYFHVFPAFNGGA